MPTLPSPGSPVHFVGITDAATMLQPHLGRLNAYNWLTDLRRASPVYYRRVFTSPRWVKREGRIQYLLSEIERIIREIHLFR